MKKKAILALVAISTLLFGRCKSQTVDEQIRATSTLILGAIKNNDSAKFISLIGLNNLNTMGKTNEMVSNDVNYFAQLFRKYYPNGTPLIRVTEYYNFLGQKLVMIPIYQGDGQAKANEMHLDVLFGPPQIAPLSKISGYRLIENNVDSTDFHPASYWRR